MPGYGIPGSWSAIACGCCNPVHPVGYIEGWYVAPKYRRRKVGTKLVAAAEEWARDQGCVRNGFRHLAGCLCVSTWLTRPSGSRSWTAAYITESFCSPGPTSLTIVAGWTLLTRRLDVKFGDGANLLHRLCAAFYPIPNRHSKSL
jgi:GNAT superfamily N-acetyltransferase